jgi:predicted ArsR family transcriptional regulator
MMEANVQRLEGTKQAILERLTPSEQHVLAVANELRIRESAIRRHFDQLERMGFVRGFFRQEGLGRPKKYYELTEWGRERFPKLYADQLERQLKRIVQDGRAPDVEEAVLVLARDRVDAHRARFQQAESPLAIARALERAVGESGITMRGRIRGDTIFFDQTSCIVLRTALHTRELGDEWRHRILEAVSQEVPAKGQRIQAGDRLCPISLPVEARPGAEPERAPPRPAAPTRTPEQASEVPREG